MKPPLQMFVSKWQLAAMLESFGPEATVEDLEAYAENLFHEPVTIAVFEAPSYFDAWLEDVAATRARVIEQACEAALVDGRYGVLVESHLDLTKFKISAEPDPSVPYGQIHER